MNEKEQIIKDCLSMPRFTLDDVLGVDGAYNFGKAKAIADDFLKNKISSQLKIEVVVKIFTKAEALQTL